jgi:hypothetical protein
MVLETWNEVLSFLGASRPSDPRYCISDVVPIRYLVQERLPVDLAVLCTIVERLFGLAIMVARTRRLGSLHGVLLPRTWILALWEDFLGYKNKRMAPLLYLAQATDKLLKDIYTGEYQRDSIRESGDHRKFGLL